MPSIRLQDALAIPKRLFEPAGFRSVRAKRAVSSSSSSAASQVIWSTPGGRKRGSELNELRIKSRQYAFDWNGVRRASTLQHSGGQPRESDSQSALGLLLGVSAVAVLAAPVLDWAQDGAGASAIDINNLDENNQVTRGQYLLFQNRLD